MSIPPDSFSCQHEKRFGIIRKHLFTLRQRVHGTTALPTDTNRMQWLDLPCHRKKLCCLAETCSKIANCSSGSRGNLKKVICKGINERTKCVLSLQLSKKKSGDGFSTGAVNNILATNIRKLTLTKTEQFFGIGCRKIGKTEQASGVEDNLNLSRSLLTLFDYKTSFIKMHSALKKTKLFHGE